jgi:acyl-CoA reductase-like NAD-dependent aldehyde dehydrogenase
MEFNVINPATEAVVATITADSEASVKAKFERCRAAQKEWRRTSMAHRKSIISKVQELLCVPAHAEELARLVTLETGRPISLSRGLMSVIPSRVDYFLGATESIVAPEPHAIPAESPFTQTLTWEPRGVVAHISAWNFPILMGVDFLVPCLLSGCATLYKPSELSPSACHYLVDLFVQAGSF